MIIGIFVLMKMNTSGTAADERYSYYNYDTVLSDLYYADTGTKATVCMDYDIYFS